MHVVQSDQLNALALFGTYKQWIKFNSLAALWTERTTSLSKCKL